MHGSVVKKKAEKGNADQNSSPDIAYLQSWATLTCDHHHSTITLLDLPIRAYIERSFFLLL